MAEASVGSARGSGTGELHATLAKQGVKRVVLGNFDGDASLAVTKVALVKKLTIGHRPCNKALTLRRLQQQINNQIFIRLGPTVSAIYCPIIIQYVIQYQF
jgi:hypothetical protein